MATLLLRNATILTMNDALDIIEGDVLVRDGRIAAVGDVPDGRVDKVIDAGGGYVLPGFVQTHVHLCQTLFRGYADDLALLDWLRTRIWPLEAAHTPASLAAATRLAATELLLGGTTTVMTMETVHDTDAVFEALEPTGLRAVVGKCLMDADDLAPARLIERTSDAIDESLALAARWHGRAHGRLHAAFAPRFAVSCSTALLEAIAALSEERGLLVHTHASENRDEVRSDPGTHRAPERAIPGGHRSCDQPPLRGALCVGQRPRAGRDGRAGRQGAALPGIEPEAWFGPLASGRDARARDFGLTRR